MQKHYQKEEMDDLYLNRKQVEDEVPENVLDNGYLLEIEQEQEQEEEKDLLNKNIPIIVPKKQKKAKKKKKGKAAKQEAEAVATTSQELNEARLNYHNVRHHAHNLDPNVQYANYSSLSMNQKIKRKKEADKRRARQKKLEKFHEEPLKGELNKWPQIEFDNRAEEFLSLSIDEFKISTDEEFANNLDHNFELYEKAELLGRQLENVVGNSITVNDDMRRRILTKVGQFREIGWWMKCKKEVMMDKHYPLLFKEDLTDYRSILKQLGEDDDDAIKSVKKPLRKEFKAIRNFLRKLKAVDDCAFVRSKFVKQESKAEVLNLLAQKGEEYAEREGKALKGREKAATEKALRDGWRDSAFAALSQKEKNPDILKDPEFTTKEEFDKAASAFLELDTTAFKFDTVENILQNVNAHDALFAKADQMHSLLAKAFRAEPAPELDQVLALRAKIAVFWSLREKQSFLLTHLCTDMYQELSTKPAMEWVRENNVLNTVPIQTLIEHNKTQLQQENAKADEKIKASFQALHPGEQIGEDALSLARKNYQKNILFWEALKGTKNRLSYEDQRNRMLAEKDQNPAPSNLLLVYMRGKSAQEIKALTDRSNGTDEEKLALAKELGDYALRSADLGAFEMNPEEPEGVLSNLAEKLTMAEASGSADQAIPTDVLLNANREKANELKLDENWKKELKALGSFSKDHLRMRMNLLVSTAEQGDPGTLGAFGMEDMHRLKADRARIREVIKAPGEKTVEQETAALFFETTNTLIQNAVEVGEQKYGQVQKKASIESSLDPVYQTYRQKEGLLGEGAAFGGLKKQIHDRIGKINANPLYSSREDLHNLRELCIATLSDYVQDIPENTWYELPTAVLKTLAMKKLKDDMPNDVVRGIVNDHLTKEKEKDLERQEPEWTEKEKDALDLIGDICDGKKDLKAILANHAEILTDLAMTRKKGQAHAGEQQKLLDQLKDKNDKLEALGLEIVKKEQASTAAFHALDANQASLTKLEAEKSALLGAAGETVGRAEELKHQVEKCDERRKLENASEEDRAYYEAEYRKNKELLETLLASEEYRRAEQEVSRAVQTDRYKELEGRILTMQDMVGALSEEAAKKDREHKELKEQQKNAEKEIDELNEAIEKQQKDSPMDVYSVMASKMAGPERALAAAVSKALLKVTEHLANKHGDEAFKLKDIRELAEQEDPELDQLLTEASKELETELQKMYQDVAAKVAEASEFILEDVTRPQRAFAEEVGMNSSGEGQPIEEWKTHFYNEKDKQRDLQQMKPLLEENERRKKKEEELNKPLLEEIERQKQEREAELKSLREERLKKSREANLKLDKEMKGENIFVPKTLRELELEKPFVPEIQLKKVPTVQEELEQLKKERLEKSRKMNEGRKENDQIFVPKTLRELELERLASLEADTGVEGLYVRQLHRRYLYTNYNFAPDQETLQTLYDRNWALDDKQEGEKKQPGEGKQEGEKKQPGEGAFVRNVMQNYFKKANKVDQRSMMTTLIRSLKPATRDRAHAHTNDTIRAGQYMAGLLLGAGPLAQKLMQGVPERYLMTEMKGAVRAVKSKLAPIPDEYVKQKFQEMIDKSNLQITEIKKLRSLGAASVGQAFLCEISGPKYKNKQVVIKLLRPEADERVERDTAVMLECAKMTSPGMEETYKGQLTKIKEELRLTNEAENCKGAEKVYKEYTENGGSSDTVHVLPEIKPEKDYLVLDKAEGITVDRYIEELDQERQELQKPFHLPVVDKETGKVTLDVEYKQTSSNVGLFKSTRLGLIHKLKELNIRQKHIQKTTELWIKESLFGKGYYHGDMHAGNIMVSDKNATVLDYGNATKLSEAQVKNITGMSAAAMFKDPRSFLDDFLTLLPKEKVDALTGANLEDEDAAFEQLKKFTQIKNEIRQDLYKIFSLGTKNDSGMRIYLGLQTIQKYGIEIPISLFSYCQSQVRLQSTLEDLNDMETSIRADLTKLDRAGTLFNVPTFGDMMMSSIKRGSKSVNPETFYRNLVTATDEVKEEDFVREVSDVSQENAEAFDAKYLSVFKQVDDLMSGKAILKAEDDDEEDQIIPIPVIETEKWKTSYEAYMKMREENPDGEQTNTLKKNLNDAIQDSFTNPETGLDNGLLAPFGGMNMAAQLTYEAIECGDRNAFRKLMKIFDEQVLPCVQFMRELRQFREDNKEDTGFFSFFSSKKIDPVAKEKKAKELFVSFKKVRDVYSDMNETVKTTREELNQDRDFYVEENTAQKVYEADLKRTFRREGVVDLSGLESLKTQWKTMDDRKKENALSPDEEKQYARVSTELVNTYKLLAGVYTEKESYRPVFDQNIASWYVLPGGEELQRAYEEFRAIQDKDIEARLKKWDDDTYAEEREKASKKFMDIYKKMTNVRMKDYVQAFDESVPPMETEEYEDEHGVTQTKQPDFASMMGRVMEGGTRIKIPFTDIEFTTNQKKMADAIGMSKATAYADGTFVPGQDLVDDITKLQKPVRKKGGQPAQPIQEAPKEVQQE